MPRLNASVKERLAARSITKASGCVVWTGPRNDAMGYGRMSVNGTMQYVHRLAWQEANGPVPEGQVLRHQCDVPNCINVDHMVLGTQRDNVADMFARGRADRRGQRNGSARLSPDQVREIRRLSKAGTSGADLARRFGVSQSQISNVINHRHWKETA